METGTKFIGTLFLMVALSAHFLLIGFFLSPADKLLPLSYSSANLIEGNEIPDEAATFITDHDLPLHVSEPDRSGYLSQINQSLLELRREKIMDEEERLALELSLLDFGAGVVGLQEAARHYYQKPLSELKPKEWITLVNLHNIFLK